MQLPTINSSYIIFTVDVGNEQEDLATYENVTEEYLVQSTVHSQTVTSPEYHDIFSKLMHSYRHLLVTYSTHRIVYSTIIIMFGTIVIDKK